MDSYGVQRARTEIRNCGWLAQVDEHGGSIFAYRPLSKGAADMRQLVHEVLELLDVRTASEATLVAAGTAATTGKPSEAVITNFNHPQ